MILKLLMVLEVLLIVPDLEGLSTEACDSTQPFAMRIISLILKNQSQTIHGGVVQMCNPYYLSNNLQYTWDYITPEGWTDTAAQIACSQLAMGHPHSTSAEWFALTLPTSVNRVTGLGTCDEGAYYFADCFPEERSRDRSRDVAALSCLDCSEGAIRLVGGSNNREGRVEVCVNGHWGTICERPRWTATEAGLICSLLGFSEYNASFSDQFGEGSGPVYRYVPCTIQSQGINSSCGLINSSPNIPRCVGHTVGVRCQAHDICKVAINHDTTEMKRSDTTSATTPTCIPSNQLGNTTDQERGSKTDCLVVTLPANEDKNIGSPINALGALTGLLAAALVVVTMGWFVSCVYWQRKNKQSKDDTSNMNTNSNSHQLDNPVYDGGTGTHSQTNYSSTGPAYEHVEADEGTGYDVINRRGAPRPHPPMTPPGSHDPTSDQDYSILEGNNYHVLESSNMTDEDNSGVRDNARYVQSQGGNNQHSNGHDPQDYEIPAPGSNRVQNA